MGTWATGPFDDDAAADFAAALDKAKPEEREALIRGVLARTASAKGRLREADEAVAAAALVAAQCPDGDPVDTDDGPEEAMPPFSADLAPLAAETLTRILADESGFAANRVDPDDANRWLTTIRGLRAVLIARRPMTSRSSTSIHDRVAAEHGRRSRATARDRA